MKRIAVQKYIYHLYHKDSELQNQSYDWCVEFKKKPPTNDDDDGMFPT